MEKEIEIPEGYEARIEGNKVIIELKESENKQIIDALTKRIQDMYDNETAIYEGVQVSDILAWLEKQKEPADGDFARGYDCGYECCLHSHGAEWFEKQKEQKPAEKQDYSELTDLERAIHRGFLVAGVENVPGTIIKETAKECLARMEPAEWSDGDEGMLNCIITTLCEESHGGREANSKMVTWLETRLKLLRPQLIQDKFDSAMHVADKFEEGYKAGVYDTKAKSWKPSKVQMKYLDVAIAEANGHKSYNLAYGLEKLKDNLKKL